MSWEAWVTVAVVVALLVALARNLASTDTALLSAFALLAGLHAVSDRFPEPRMMVQAFGNEGLVTIGALFVVAAGLSSTGAAQAAGLWLLGRPRSLAGAQLRLMLPVMGMSAFVNNTPVVAALVPVVKEWARACGLGVSRLFIPLSYAAILGGACTLIGTSTNLVVQGLLIEAELPAMGMFTLTPVGVPVALAGLAYVLLLSRRLLPERTASRAPLSDPRQYSVMMRVRPSSPTDGKSIEDAGLRSLPGLYLAEVERGETLIPAVEPSFVLRGGDILLFVGLVQSVADLQRINGLEPATDQVWKLDVPRSSRCLVEAVVSNASPLVGRTIRDSGFRTRYGAVVLAVHRNGERVRQKVGDVTVHPGDTLLLETRDHFVERYRDDSQFLVVSKLDGPVVLQHEKALLSGLILAAVVVGAALEPITGVGILACSLLGAVAMVVTRCCSVDQARRSVEWPVLLSIGAALGIARVLDATGAAGAIAAGILEPTHALGPHAALICVYGVTLLLTETITNNAAAALAFPIAAATASQLGVSIMPFAIAVALAASAGYATPLGYQTHLMVYGVGGYRFMDFVRLGLGMDLLCMVVAVMVIPLVFPF